MLIMNDLLFRWPNQAQWQIDIPHFSLAKGEKLFLKGASGSGKSTLLGLLAGINQPQSGEIKIDDCVITALKGSRRDKFRADHIGYIFQQFNLLPYLSVIDNVLLPCRFSALRRSRVNGGLHQEATRLLLALALPESCLEKPVIQLSIGQQQRVAAARALIGHPSLLLIDEPTSALDTDNRDAFIRLLLQECQQANTSMLFVSHDSALQTYFDRVINLTELNHCHNAQDVV